MEQDNATHRVDPHLVTRIVGSYVRHHKIGVDQLAGLVAEVNRVLGGLGRVAPPEEARAPAVPVGRSVRRDYVVCLDCGHRGVTLRGHIRVTHGLEPTAYRDRWKLSADHPLTAPSYSARRSTLAKQLGLGRSRRHEAVAPPPAPAPATPPGGATAAELDPAFAASPSVAKRRRGRPRKQPSPMA
jgi:predicted transcriptional regulator